MPSFLCHFHPTNTHSLSICLVVGVDLPEIFDTAYIRAGPVGDRVSTDSLQVIIGLGGLGPRLYEQVGNNYYSSKMYVSYSIYPKQLDFRLNCSFRCNVCHSKRV